MDGLGSTRQQLEAKVSLTADMAQAEAAVLRFVEKTKGDFLGVTRSVTLAGEAMQRFITQHEHALKASIGGGGYAALTNNLNTLKNVTVKLGQQNELLGFSFKRAFDTAGTASEQLDARLNKLTGRLHWLNNNVQIIGIASAAAFVGMVKAGTDTADQLKVIGASFRGITGSEANANVLMQQLRDYAVEAKVPFGEILTSAQQLAPNLKLSGIQLNRMTEALDVARRLSLLNMTGPGGGQEGAAIALTESLQGDYQSLRRRFNISPDVFRSYLKQSGGDQIKALDKLLNDLGLTTKVAAEAQNTFGRSLQRLGDSLSRLMATTLQPFLDNFLIPAIDKVTALVDALLAGDSSSARFAGGLALLTTGGIAAIATISKLLEVGLELRNVLNTIKIANVATGVAGAAPVAGAGMGAGAGTALSAVVASLPVIITTVVALTIAAIAGYGITKLVKTATGEDTNYSVDDFLKDLSEGAKNLIGTIDGLMTMLYRTIGDNLIPVFGMLEEAMLSTIASLFKLVPKGIFANAGIDKDRAVRALEGRAAAQQLINAKRQADFDKFMADEFAKRRGFGAGSTGAGGSLAGTLPGTGTSIADTLLPDWQAYMDKLSELDSKFQSDRLKVMQDTDAKVLAQIDDTNIERVKLWTDFVNKQEAAQADLDHDIANEKQQANDRIVSIEKDAHRAQQQALAEHQLKMQRMQEDHELALQDAAGQLDAVAFYEEQQRYALERKRAEEDFALSQQQTADNVKDQVKEEKQQLAQRLQRMKEEFAVKQLAERKDFELKMAQFETDRQNELSRIRQAGTDKIAELQAQLDTERASLKAALEDKVATALGIETAGHAASLSELQLFIDAVKAKFASLTTTTSASTGGSGGGTASGSPKAFAQGGVNTGTGLRLLHDNELVMSPTYTRALSSMLGGNLTQEKVVQAAKGGNTVKLHMPVNVNGNGDMLAQAKMLVQLVMQEIEAQLA